MQVATDEEPAPGPRIPLSKERVLRTAVGVADERGIGALTMRGLAEELGAEAMSLYYHVAKKDDILDGIVELVVREINDVVDGSGVSAKGDGWRKAVRHRILSAREVFLRHRWAPLVMETRTGACPAVLRYFDGLLGLMLEGGFSPHLAHQALHALGSRALGFSRELFDPDGTVGETAAAEAVAMAEQLPHLAGMLNETTGDGAGWCDTQAEFEFGLDLILDGLERLREANWPPAT